MKMIMKFKDGITVSNDLGEDFKIEGDGDFLRLMLQGKMDNKSITLNTQAGTIEKNFSDLYSVEIVFAD